MSEDKRELEDTGRLLPSGISAAFVDREGKVNYIPDSLLHDMRWEGLEINSTAFKKLSAPERLYEQSQAFLHAAIVLCEDAGETGADLKWPQANVCYYCLHLATELFLKACLICVNQEPKKLNHEIPDLLRQYRDLLPGKKFDWPTPWFLSARDLAEIFGHEVLQGVDRTPDQLFRYGMDKKGTTSAGVQFFTPGYLFNYMKHINTRWSEIWACVNSMNDG
jgi:HEPN domain-containing protein